MGELAQLNGLSTARQSEWIDHLFDKLWRWYGTKFSDMWAGQSVADVKGEWRAELGDMTKTEIDRGIDACRTREWPPTLPEFIRLCRPPPDPERAFSEATRQMQARRTGRDKWSDPVVFWAAASLGGDLLAMSYAALKSRWADALETAAEKLRNGELPREIPARVESLPPPGKCSVPAVEQRRRLAAVRKRLSVLTGG